MNGIHFSIPCNTRDIIDIEIGLHQAFPLAHQITLICLEAVQRKPSLIRINRNGANAKLINSAKHAYGNLTPVGNKDGFECL
jgi:hypothetical protein